MKESDLNEGAKQFLIDRGCTKIYGELYDMDLFGITDDNITYAVEMKTNLSTKVLEQAYKRKGLANYTYVVVPDMKNIKHFTSLNEVYKQFVTSNGIGIVVLNYINGKYTWYQLLKHAKLDRQAHINISKIDENKLNKDGGMTSSNRYSPYKKTYQEVMNVLKSKNTYVTLEEIIEDCPYYLKKYYSNPKAFVYKVLSRNQQVEVKKIDRKNYYRFKEK